jgi:hypothetical protein
MYEAIRQPAIKSSIKTVTAGLLLDVLTVMAHVMCRRGMIIATVGAHAGGGSQPPAAAAFCSSATTSTSSVARSALYAACTTAPLIRFAGAASRPGHMVPWLPLAQDLLCNYTKLVHVLLNMSDTITPSCGHYSCS